MLVRMWRKREPLQHCWWDCKLLQPLQKAVWRFLKKLKLELPYDDPALPLLGVYIYGKNKNTNLKRQHAPQCSQQHSLKQPRHGSNPSAHQQMIGLRRCGIHIHTHTHTNGILAIKKNEILPFAAMWMDLENIVLSEISQTEKDKYCMISLICGT